jgi:hypothetical protein
MYRQIGSVMIVCRARCGKVVKLVCLYSLAIFICKLEKRCFIGCQMLSQVKLGISCEGSCPFVLQISVSASPASCVPTATEGGQLSVVIQFANGDGSDFIAMILHNFICIFGDWSSGATVPYCHASVRMMQEDNVDCS